MHQSWLTNCVTCCWALAPIRENNAHHICSANQGCGNCDFTSRDWTCCSLPFSMVPESQRRVANCNYIKVKAHHPQTTQQPQTTTTTATVTSTNNSNNNKQLQTNAHNHKPTDTHRRLARRQLGPQRRPRLAERCQQNASDQPANSSHQQNIVQTPKRRLPSTVFCSPALQRSASN